MQQRQGSVTVGSGRGSHGFGRAFAVVAALGLFVSCSSDTGPGGADAGVATKRIEEPLTASEWPTEAVVATNSIWLQDRTDVIGAVAVTKAASQTLSSNAELVLGPEATVTGNAKADTLVVMQHSLITAGASYNTKQGAGTIQGGTTTPLALPLAIAIPAFPSVTPGTQNVTVNGSQQQSLASGNYAAVTVNNGTPTAPTKLTLTGGLYQLSSLTVQNNTIVECSAACEVRVNGRASFADRAKLRPKAGVAGLGVGNVQLLVKGSNGASGPQGQPSALQFGNDSEARAYLFVPNGTLKLGDRIVQRGKLLGKDVWLGQDGDAEGKQLPIITGGPDSLTVSVGQSATFSVTVTGTGLSYQWQKDGANIPGATGASYTVASAAQADNGKQFRVVVSNGAGSVTSGAATLTVTNCTATDETCDGVDDDCNQAVDDGFVVVCGTGASRILCIDGEEVEEPCAVGEACNGGTCAPEGAGGSGNEGGGTGGSSGSGGGGGEGGGGGGPGDPGGTEFEFLIQLPKGVHRSQVALGATGGKVKVSDYAQVLGQSGGYASVSSVGDFFGTGAHMDDFARAKHVWTEGVATLDPFSHVFGDVKSKGISKSPWATVDGAVDPAADLRPLEEIRWSVLFPDETAGAQLLAPGEVRALTPGAYGPVSVPDGARLELGWGDYTFESLDVHGTLDFANIGPVKVYVEGAFSYDGFVERDSEVPNVFVGVAGGGWVFLKKAFTGIVVAPEADVVLKKPDFGEHRGSFFGKSVTLEDHGRVRQEAWDPGRFCLLPTSENCGGFCPCGVGGECESGAQCSPALVCGPLGVCACSGSCEGKACGDTPNDGCGGLCQDYCPAFAQGCNTNIECEGATICISGTCLPPSCGSTSCNPSECGEACGECVPQCSGRECGPDPLCGTACGQCPGDGVCDNGFCLTSEQPRPELPPHPGTQVGASTVGTLDGEFGVSPTGGANYTLPIELPPGQGGVKPSLALAYTGGSSPGPVGAGWALVGVPSIARCKKSIAVDGWPQPIEGRDSSENADERDAVCLENQRLVLVEGEHLRDGARYRTEFETFRDITYRGTGTASYWEVRSKDGSFERYGADATWSMLGTGFVTLQWPLIQRRNRAGIGTWYAYECRGWSQAGLFFLAPSIKSISYGMLPNATPTQGPTHIVRFVYEARGQSYAGTAIAPLASARLTERIAEISVSGPAGFMYRYRLAYAGVDAGVNTREDFLSNVTRCIEEPPEEVCLSPTRFDYERAPNPPVGGVEQEFLYPGEDQVMAWPPTFAGGAIDKNDEEKILQLNAKATLMLDWNGDGRPDFLHPSLDGDWALTVGLAQDGALFSVPQPLGVELSCVSASSIADLNGDGRSDILEQCPGANGVFVMRLSTGNLAQPFVTVPIAGTGHDTVLPLDVDADGLPELIACTPPVGTPTDPSSGLLRNTAGFLATPTYVEAAVLPARDANNRVHYCPGYGSAQSLTPTRQPPLLADLDADGAQNILVPPFTSQIAAGKREFLSVRAGYDMRWIETDAAALTSWPAPARSLDVNGDGLLDILLSEAYYPSSGVTIPPADVVRVSDPLSLGYRTTLYLNTLHGEMNPTAFYLPRIEEGLTEVSDTTDPMNSGVTHDAFNRLRVMDVDRDGRDELVVWRRFQGSDALLQFVNEEPNTILPTSIRLRAESVFRVQSEDRFMSRGIAPLIADFDSDGSQDLLLYSVDDGVARLYRGYQPERFLLKQVTDGLGNRVAVGYGGASAYAPGTACSEHTRCLPAVGPLVEFLRFYERRSSRRKDRVQVR